jgi:hypothetical protein
MAHARIVKARWTSAGEYVSATPLRSREPALATNLPLTLLSPPWTDAEQAPTLGEQHIGPKCRTVGQASRQRSASINARSAGETRRSG